MSTESNLIPAERIERRILLVRGQKVLLDFQLAELYEVETKALNQAVKRNLERFPEDFMFQLSEEESTQILRSQFVTSSAAPPSKHQENGVNLKSQIVTSSYGNRSQSVTGSSGDATKSTEPPADRWSQSVTTSTQFRRATYHPYAFKGMRSQTVIASGSSPIVTSSASKHREARCRRARKS